MDFSRAARRGCSSHSARTRFDVRQAAEVESRHFYERAAARMTDPASRQLLDDLAQAERSHEERADALEKERLTPAVQNERTGPASGCSFCRWCSPASPA